MLGTVDVGEWLHSLLASGCTHYWQEIEAVMIEGQRFYALAFIFFVLFQHSAAFSRFKWQLKVIQNQSISAC